MPDVQPESAEPVDLSRYAAIKDELRRCVELGWAVFPVYEAVDGRCSCSAGNQCGSPGKHPRLGRAYEPSSDAKQLAAWWRRWPGANIGLVPGKSDLVILDVDPRNGGDDTLVALERMHGELPSCPTSLTGGGGWHFLFKRPESMLNCSSATIGPGFEVKADTGYVVLPPSEHVSGRQYAWDVGRHISDTPVPDLPGWLCVLLATRKGVEPLPSDPRGPAAGLMGAAFAAAGWSGQALGRDKAAVLCPFRNEHSTGKDLDGSTVVFAPTMGHRAGWFHCSHSHCSTRKQLDVLAELPLEAVDAAKRLLGIDEDFAARDERRTMPLVDDILEAKPPDPHWKSSLVFNQKLVLTPDIGNAVLILTHDPAWKGALRFDAFHERGVWGKAPTMAGWASPEQGTFFDGDGVAFATHWFMHQRGVRFGIATMTLALATAAKQQRFDSLVEWLDGLKWDGVSRIDTWTTKYLGSRDVEYTRFVGRAWLVSAIARAYKPGCQADHMLILEGRQGNRKTSALEALVGEWLLRDMPDLRNKDSMVNLCGKWIVNFEELSGLSRQEWTKIKAFLTQRVDTFRPPYGATAIDRPRRCVFAGTSNRDDYLSDETGGRRFWPLHCTTIDIDGLATIRNQLWAEARDAWQAGANWWTENPQRTAEVELEQSLRQDADPWDSRIARALEDDQSRAWQISELLGSVLSLEPAKQDQKAAQRVGKILRRSGFIRFRSSAGHWAWRRAGSNAQPYGQVDLPDREPGED